MDNLLDRLNAQQVKAVTAPLKPTCVLAGAGSGKTTVLTRRIAWLVQEKGIDPERILAVTFTKKAADEMAERVRNYLPDTCTTPHMSTFHSLGYFFLRHEIDKVEELTEGFSIIDSYQQKAYVQEAMREIKLAPKLESVGAFMGRINGWKARQLTADEAVKKIKHNFKEQKFFDCYKKYETILRRENKADFTDLLFLTAQLFDRHKEVVQKYQQIFPYILVDEYQDTSPLQYKILVALARHDAPNLYVVGDNDQAIYGFRGADVGIILSFKQDFEKDGAETIILEKNYRSYPKIVEAANGVIANNSERFDKKLVSTRCSRSRIVAHQAYTPEWEALWVAEKVMDEVKKGERRYTDFTVLVRNNALTAPLEAVFGHEHVPYTVVGGKSFFDRMEVLDVIAYMKFLLNTENWQAFSRIANRPSRRFGKTSMNTLKENIDMGEYTLTAFLEGLAKSYRKSRGPVRAGHMRLARFYRNTGGIRQNPKVTVADALDFILASEDDGGCGYGTFLTSLAEPPDMRQIREDNIYGLLALAKPNETLADFIPRFERIRIMAKKDLNAINSVKLMTIHGAKGLEFPVVFIVGAEENILPSWHCGDSQPLIEEERRVFYVAMTRARDELYISSCYKRVVKNELELRDPSRFSLEIPADAYEGSWQMSPMEVDQYEAAGYAMDDDEENLFDGFE